MRKNCACSSIVSLIGYTSLGGDRLERYGAGVLEFVFVTEDGTYLDFTDESLLRQYEVVA